MTRKFNNIYFLFYKLMIVLLSGLFMANCSGPKQSIKSQDSFSMKVLNKDYKEANYLNSKIFWKAKQNLISKANKLLKENFKSVIDKPVIPPSGDKHDYLSTAVYYWPNPNTKDGLPWIYKDGEYNGEALKKTDHSNYYKAMEAIRNLSLAYNITSDTLYAKRAVEIIIQWFIDSKTKMNPNLNYAQGIPGYVSGFASGIIDSRAILWIINSLPFLEHSGYWTDLNNNIFKRWCSDFLDWLLTSKFGEKESKSNNNHGTFYDLQVATFADYIGKYDLAKTVIENVKRKRVAEQIKQDGSMPEELKRTRPHMYSIFNLSAFISLAELGDKYGIDLWNYKTKKSGSIKDAIDFLIKNSTPDQAKLFKGNMNTKNMLRIIPKANKKFKGEYDTFLHTELKKNNNVDLTSIYFVN